MGLHGAPATLAIKNTLNCFFNTSARTVKQNNKYANLLIINTSNLYSINIHNYLFIE